MPDPLTHSAGLGIEPASPRSGDAADTVASQRELRPCGCSNDRIYIASCSGTNDTSSYTENLQLWRTPPAPKGQTAAGRNKCQPTLFLSCHPAGWGWIPTLGGLGASRPLLGCLKGQSGLCGFLVPFRMLSPSTALSSKATPSTTPWSSCSGCWTVCTRTWRARPGARPPTRSVTLQTLHCV